MISPSDYPKFFTDIKQSNTTVYPLIQIGDEIFISQVKESFDGQVYEDHNLKISNIKESIDFESRNFKISNVSITLSNYADLADKLSSINLMNLPIHIYWKTQSCTTIDDCLKVYQANVRRFDHDEKRISIKLEDSTQEKFKKEVPIANLGETQFVYSDKYINKYIPITFGKHEYAPAIIWRPNQDSLDFQIICDDVWNIYEHDNRDNIVTYFDDSINTLRAYKGTYVDILATATDLIFVNPGDYEDKECYTVDSSGFINCLLKFDAGRILNPFANNEFQAEFKRYPDSLGFINSDGKPFDGITYPDNITFQWAGDVGGDEISISNPKAAHDKYGNIFTEHSGDTFARIPDIDDDGEESVEDDESDQIQSDYEAWKTTNLVDFYNRTSSLSYNLHGTSYERDMVLDYESVSELWGSPVMESKTIGGDMFDFQAYVLEGIRFQGANGLNDILYNYGHSGSAPHNQPTSLSDISFTYAGGANSIDWVGWRDGTAKDVPTWTTYTNPYGETGYYFKTHPEDGADYQNYDNDNDGDLDTFTTPTTEESYNYEYMDNFFNEAKYAGLVIDSTAASSGTAWWGTGGPYGDTYGLSEPSADSVNMNPSPIPRIKYLHAVESEGLTNFIFIQLPSAQKIMERLVEMQIVPRYGTVQHYSDPTAHPGSEYYGIWTESYGQTNFNSFLTGSSDEFDGYANQCQYTDPYMDRCIIPYIFEEYIAHTSDFMWHHSSVNWQDFIMATDTFVGGNGTSTRRNGYSTQKGLMQDHDKGEGFEDWDSLTDHRVRLTYHGHYFGGAGGNNPTWTYDYDDSPAASTGGHHTHQPQLHSINPYGNTLWTFGVRQHSKRTGSASAYEAIQKFVTVTFDPTSMNFDETQWAGDTFMWGDDAIDKSGGYSSRTYTAMTNTQTYNNDSFAQQWAWKVGNKSIYDEPDSGFNGHYLKDGFTSGVKGHYSLTELFDMSQFPIYIPFKMNDTGIDYANDSDAKFINPSYDCYWNGVPPDQSTQLGEAGASAGSKLVPNNTSQFYDGGEGRWFALSLKDIGSYTKCGFIQNCFGGYRASAGSEDVEYGYIKPSGGDILGVSTSDDFFHLRANDSSNVFQGKFLGVRFNIPEISLEDNIDLAHNAFWERKIELKRHDDGNLSLSSNATNYLYLLGAAMDVRETDDAEQGDTLKSCTTVLREKFSDINNTVITLNNIDGNPTQLSSTLEPDSLSDDYAVSLFNGVGDNGAGSVTQAYTIPGGFNTTDFEQDPFITPYVNWGNPNDFNAFSMLVMADREAEATSGLDVFYQMKIFNSYIKHVADFEKLTDSDFYVATNGRASGNTSIEYPGSVIQNIMETELNLATEDIDITSIGTANTINQIKLAFSVKDKIDCKKLIEEICSNTKIFPRISNENKVELISIKDEYNTSGYDAIIEYNKILKYKFTRTKLDEVKSKIMVKYDLDYATDDFRKNTGWFSAKDFLADGGLEDAWINPTYGEPGYRAGLFNLSENEIDSELIFESRYIRDRDSAYKLQEFLAMWFCNQHTIIDLTLDISYINLEVGDIISFDKAVNDVKAYGEDYSDVNFRNGQVIYPLFMITSVSRKSNKISIKCIQLHKLTREKEWIRGDVSRNGISITELDFDYLELYLDGDESFTREQIKAMDVNDTSSVNKSDKLFMLNQLN